MNFVKFLKTPLLQHTSGGCFLIFNIASAKLERDALQKQVTRETFKQFSRRVGKTLRNINPKIIDHTIESMNKRIELILAKIKKFWEGKECSGTADNNRREHRSVFDVISAPSSKNFDNQESGDFNFKDCVKDIR